VNIGHSGEPPQWRKSSRCGTGACVEVATGDTVVGMRDSKDPHSPALSFSHAEWRVFIDGVKDGNFDLQ
jgi:hypothetical protein